MLIKFSDINEKIITVRNERVILDSDVAALYGVETKRINEAFKNNPDKFPKGYVIELESAEWTNLKSKISTSSCENVDLRSKNLILENQDNPEEQNSLRSNFSTLKKQGRGQHVKYLPKAFTEKGLYMLATILKSPQATQTTIAIVEAFAKIRELSRTVAELSETTEEFKQKSLMQKGGEIIADILNDDLKITDEETSIELNFAVLKFKHTVKKKLGTKN